MEPGAVEEAEHWFLAGWRVWGAGPGGGVSRPCGVREVAQGSGEMMGQVEVAGNCGDSEDLVNLMGWTRWRGWSLTEGTGCSSSGPECQAPGPASRSAVPAHAVHSGPGSWSPQYPAHKRT